MDLGHPRLVRTLTVVCPVYNEAEVVGSFYGVLKSVLQELGDSYDSTVLFVVDRSEDDSLAILKGIAATDPQRADPVDVCPLRASDGARRRHRPRLL